MRDFLLRTLQRLQARRDARLATAATPAGDARAPLDALLAEGEALEQAGQHEAALRKYREAIALAPASALAQVCAGNMLYAMQHLPEAEVHYRRAIALDPAYGAARLNLGNVLLAQGDGAGAADAYREATRLRPDWAEAWTGLGAALGDDGPQDAAIDAYRRALQIDPAHAGAARNLAQLLAKDRPAEALAVLEAALARAADRTELLGPLADIHGRLGELDTAVRLYREVLAARPDDQAAASTLLFTLTLLPSSTTAALLAEHRQWGERLAASIRPAHPRRAADPRRRLRIGYVSPDFRQHPIAQFMAPVLRHHDPEAVETFCYANHERDDEITEQLRPLCGHWRHVRALDDDALARHIGQDAIDVLVDLAGHTAGHRLLVFARKPAPVQMTWLGYLGTTGLAAMDYRICDRHTDPPGRAEAWQVETPARLPHSQWCYEPVSAPAASPLPRLARGYWTFGSYNQTVKLNEPLLEAWAALLASVPDSRLRIANVLHAPVRDRFVEIFTQRGIAAGRIVTLGRMPLADYLASHADVDVALDSLPYTGATTTCDALLMGVPVATVAGDRPVARSGVSLMTTLGLTDWIAGSLADLPAVVRRQLADPAALAQLRAELPARMRASKLMDAPAFTRDLEQLYRKAWQDWCATQ
jgi:protein O-GlcNAc transferase